MPTGPFTMWGFIYRLSLFRYIYINTCILYPSFILHCSPSISHHYFYRITTYLAYKYVRVIHMPTAEKSSPRAESQPSSSNGQDDFESEPVPHRKTC